MGQEAIVETLPSWIRFLGGPCFQPRLNGRLACQQMLCSGISVSLLGYKSPFPQDKRGKKKERGKKKQRTWKGCSGETRMRGNLYCEIMCSDVRNRILGIVCQFVFWPSEHVSSTLSSVGISSVAVQYIKNFLRVRHKPVTWHDRIYFSFNVSFFVFFFSCWRTQFWCHSHLLQLCEFDDPAEHRG